MGALYTEMKIIKYTQEFKWAFIDLNLAWLNKYFRVETQDMEMLNGVDDLIECGAAVYFAVQSARRHNIDVGRLVSDIFYLSAISDI